MANIGVAQVEAFHIPDGAVSEYATGSRASDSSQFGTKTQDVTIANEAGTPVELWIDGLFTVESASGTSVQGSATVGVKRKSDGVYLFNASPDHSTSGSFSIPVKRQAIDLNAAVNQVYTIEVSASKTGGTLSGDKATISCNLTLIAAKK